MFNEFIKILEDNEKWLMGRILHYSKLHNFTKYTSTLEEAWRISIAGLSDSIAGAIREYDVIPDFGPDEAFENDFVSQFGLLEAQKHRSRGVTLTMFLGLLKYYKQTYIDLIILQEYSKERIEELRTFIERCFDRIELAFCSEWTKLEKDKYLAELQDNNRRITNEKNAYLTAFESLSDPSIIINDKLEIVNLNYSAANLFSDDIAPGKHYYRKSEYMIQAKPEFGKIIGSSLADIFPWLNESYFTTNIDSITDKNKEIEIQLNDANRFFEINYSPMLDVSEKFLGAVITFRDITEQRQAREALRLSEEQFRGAFETAAHGMLLVSPNRTIFKMNKAFQDITGYSEEELIGRNVFDITHKDDIQPEINNIRKIISGEINSFQNIKRYIHKKGHFIWVMISVSLVREKDGAPLHFVGQIIDITDRLRAENELKLLNEELENRVIERTEELETAKNKIEEALSKEKEYGVMKSRFINMISHEYRTPLTEINNGAELIKIYLKNGDVEKIHSILNRINVSIAALTNLIEDVTIFSDSESHMDVNNPAPVNVYSFAEIICGEVGSLVAGNRRIILKPLGMNFTAMLDKNKFRFILTQLLINALKYSPDNSAVTVSVEELYETFKLTVADNGVGISEKDIDKLFLPFYKGSESIGVKSGLGLGLAVVKKFTDAMKGRIDVNSRPGKGSEFIVEFPKKP